MKYENFLKAQAEQLKLPFDEYMAFLKSDCYESPNKQLLTHKVSVEERNLFDALFREITDIFYDVRADIENNNFKEYEELAPVLGKTESWQSHVQVIYFNNIKKIIYDFLSKNTQREKENLTEDTIIMEYIDSGKYRSETEAERECKKLFENNI